MSKEAVVWGRMMYPLLVHGATKLRDRAVVVIKKGMPHLIENQQVLSKYLKEDLDMVSYMYRYGNLGKLYL